MNKLLNRLKKIDNMGVLIVSLVFSYVLLISYSASKIGDSTDSTICLDDECLSSRVITIVDGTVFQCEEVSKKDFF